MLNKQQSQPLLDLMAEAEECSHEHHSRMRHELAIYNNRNSYTDSTTIGSVSAIAHESLNPEIQKGIIRLVPAFTEQAARIEILPDKSKHSAEDAESVEDLTQWTQMYQEIDAEGERLEHAVYQNLIFGHAVSKAIYDPRYRVVRMIPVSPLGFPR